MDVAGVHEVTYGYVLAEHANILAVIEKVDAILVEQVSQREDLTAALTSIINEQASQRTDLTATLTAIWDKVKGL